MVDTPRSRPRRHVPSVIVLVCAALLAGGLPALAADPPAGPDMAVTKPGVTAAFAAAGATAPPAEVQVVVIGDSLSTGRDTPGYPWTIPAQQGLDGGDVRADIINSSISGIGYVAQGSVGITFADLVSQVVTPQAGIVVLFGSDNDSAGPALTGAVAATLDLAERDAPDADVVVVSPPATPANAGSDLAAVTETLRDAAAMTHAGFVDATYWFGPDPANVLGSDGEHPNTSGENLLGGEFDAVLQPMITARLAVAAR